MTPSEIQPKMKFGHWEVIKFHHTNEHRIKYFLCKCDVCGKEKPVRGTALIQGTSTACSKQCNNDISNMTFGKWTVLRPDKSRPRYYVCKCNCGTIKSVFSGSLKSGTSKSCGCYKTQQLKEKNNKNANSHIGEKYGKLTVLDCYKNEKDGAYWYKCKCDCGAFKDVSGKRLFNGMCVSCGCLDSKANMLMDQLLTSKNIPFKREYTFPDLKDVKLLRFDFALFNMEQELIGLIELNGTLHYSASGTGWDTPERLIRQQKHDYMKRLYCEENRIPFLVIPYQFFNDLETFLCSSDFWQIVIKNFND